VINVSPLWTLQCLSSGPDQMLRQRALTAKRTMTRAGDVNGLDEGAAIRERPSGCKGVGKEFRSGAVAVVCPACLLRPRPLAQMGSAIHSQTDERPCWPPPYTGCADRRTDRSASSPLSPAPAADERLGGGRPRPVGLPARHHGPHDSGCLRLTNGLTYCAGISRTRWPRAAKARPQ
jgi:hypothetical protein